MYVCRVITYIKRNYQRSKVARPARGQLTREKKKFPVPVPRQPAHLHAQAESGCLLTELFPSSAAASIYLFIPPCAIGSVPSLPGHAIAYLWRLLPRVRRHRASTYVGILCSCVAIATAELCTLKKNQNAPRLSEHPPVRGEKNYCCTAVFVDATGVLRNNPT